MRMIRIPHLCKIFFNGFFLLFIGFFSCEEFVKIDQPQTQISRLTVYSDDAAAISAIRGIYSEMARISAFSGGSGSVALFTGTSADELIDLTSDTERVQFFTNSLISTNSVVLNSLWAPIYRYIYYSNSMLEGLKDSNGISDKVRAQLQGEAKFIRAFSYFYLVNLFGEVPLITTTDYRQNSKAARSPIDIIYQQIINDLKDAAAALPEDYSHSNGERVRPNKWAAKALLSRVYLYTGDWENSENEASEVIDNAGLYSLETDFSKIFLANSSEAIWQLMPVEEGYNTNEANTFRPQPGGVNNIVALTEELVSSFEPSDSRKVNWVDTMTFSGTLYYYPYKYKIQGYGFPLQEYSMVLRLAEQFLIRAEARAQQQQKLLEAVADLDVVRGRADLPSVQTTIPEITQADILSAIAKERRVELFSEWGHRWIDLKRTNRADEILNQVKMDWQATDVLYPIPESERSNDPNLSQNLGY